MSGRHVVTDTSRQPWIVPSTFQVPGALQADIKVTVYLLVSLVELSLTNRFSIARDASALLFSLVSISSGDERLGERPNIYLKKLNGTVSADIQVVGSHAERATLHVIIRDGSVQVNLVWFPL
jgi:hypothetical protein